MKRLPTHVIGAFAIIRDSAGRVLISRRSDNGWYNLPGGGLEVNEAPVDGLVREVLEETGLEVKIQRLIGVYLKPDVSEVVFSFEAQIVGGTLQNTSEADHHQWVTLEELENIQIFSTHIERIKDALREGESAILKNQVHYI